MLRATRPTAMLLILAVACLCFAPRALMAQNVIIVPKEDKPKDDPVKKAVDNPADAPKSQPAPKESAPNTFLLPVTPDTTKSATSGAKNNPSNAVVIPPRKTGKKPGTTDAPANPLSTPEFEAMLAAHNKSVSDAFQKMLNPPTQIIQQPDFRVTEEQKFDHGVNIEFDKVSFSNIDLQKIAKGTELKADKLLKNCEQRVTGSLVAKDGSAELIDVRGKEIGRSGYRGTMSQISLVLALACKLEKVPVNKGVIPKFGDYYVFGVSQANCEVPANSTATRVLLSYEGDGKPITCEFK